jgi:hypothetical protein
MRHSHAYTFSEPGLTNWIRPRAYPLRVAQSGLAITTRLALIEAQSDSAITIRLALSKAQSDPAITIRLAI